MPKPKMRNWGTYIKNLKACGVNPKVVSILEQIKDLYRNPIIHPETRLDIEEALSLLGIAESAISAMVMDIVARQAAKASNQSNVTTLTPAAISAGRSP
jgi:hypothetical protein